MERRMHPSSPHTHPLHSEEAVFLHLQHLVASAELAPGHKLPSERKLAETLGERRSAVRDVMHTMRTFGLVNSRRGSGTYLCDDLRGYASLPVVIAWAAVLGSRARLFQVRWSLHLLRGAFIHP